MSDWEIHLYHKDQEAAWDQFVQNESINGTFLQEWRFLNYHPEGHFIDCSLMLYHKGRLASVIPACEVIEKGTRVFFSHKGSTYGGPVLSKQIYHAEELLDLIQSLECYLKAEGFGKIVLKPTLSLLCSQGEDLLEYCLYNEGYTEYKELELYINYAHYNKNILSNLTHMKQRLIKKCIAAGITVRELDSDSDITEFHRILTLNLEKYGVAPVHTTAELIDLKNNRLGKKLRFYGAYIDGQLVAGTMVFHFEKSKCAHTQYLCADPDFNKLSPLSYIYYDMAKRYYDLDYKYLSWGITSEHLGTQLNMGLTKNKESFGSEYMINHIYEKMLVE